MGLKIKIIIPVTDIPTEKLNDVLSYSQSFLMEDTSLAINYLKFGFPSVESDLQGIFNGSEVVREVIQNSSVYDGVFIDCFDDPGVYACRELGYKPVLGPYQAAMSVAMSIGERIGIITTDEAGILSEERKLRLLGAQDRVVSIRDIDLGVADIRKEKEKILEKLTDTSTKMIQEDRVSVIVLGCTAMYFLAGDLRTRLKARNLRVNVIEPLSNGINCLESMIRMGYSNFIPGQVNMNSLKWNNK